MKCPHCSTAINLNIRETIFKNESLSFDDYEDEEIGYALKYGFCPECNKLIILLSDGTYCNTIGGAYIADESQDISLYPEFPSASHLSDSVPKKYITLFQEAEQVNNISPRASATLSRYILQMILHEELNIKKGNLEKEITELESKTDIPSTLIILLQVMRKVANFAAHPKKSTNSAEIVDVEKGESEVMLELLLELFDYLFVKPAKQNEFLKEIKDKYGIESEVK